ncbi:MAG: HAD-IA family hydrolase [Desulfofustis sp.]|nr:HAD-IA family hydrolase [Desulfofustis sp.]
MTLPQALFFDMDGVIIDTEKDGHRIAFNQAFSEFGFEVFWDVDHYGELIRISGGKERMRHHLETRGFGRPVDASQADELIRTLHKRKTEIFIDLIEGGGLKLRPGIHRLMKEANDRNVPICICTTATQKAAQAVAAKSLPDIRFAHILAGDIVARKKPAPDIYLLALEKTGADAARCVVVEDSRNGMLAGVGAGAQVVVTTSIYTRGENFDEAALAVTCLGDPAGERGTLIRGEVDGYQGVLTLDMLAGLLS